MVKSMMIFVRVNFTKEQEFWYLTPTPSDKTTH